jgi:hypothetical protein
MRKIGRERWGGVGSAVMGAPDWPLLLLLIISRDVDLLDQVYRAPPIDPTSGSAWSSYSFSSNVWTCPLSMTVSTQSMDWTSEGEGEGGIEVGEHGRGEEDLLSCRWRHC